MCFTNIDDIKISSSLNPRDSGVHQALLRIRVEKLRLSETLKNKLRHMPEDIAITSRNSDVDPCSHC